MLFCPHCASLLLLEQVNGLRLYCNICNYRCTITEDITVRHSLPSKTVEDALGGAEAWRRAEKVDTQCQAPMCPGTKAFFFEVQTRGDDEPNTKFFKCVTCSHKWREG